jgi:hypothetical protein
MKRDVNTACTECGGSMEDGSVVDFRRNMATAGEWVAGEVVASGWTGALKNAERFVIDAYRCVDCGSLKLYARTRSSSSAWG